MSDNNSWRYITLTGDKPHTPLRKAFFQAADFKLGLVVSAMTAAIMSAADPKASSPLVNLALCAAVITLVTYMQRRNEHPDTSFVPTIKFPASDFNNKVIDTQPDQNIPPTSAQDLLYAQNTADSFKADIKRMSVITACAMGYFLAFSNPMMAPALILSSAPSFLRSYLGKTRFEKVANGDWVIADTPPPKKVTETQEEKTPALTRPQADMSP